MKNSAAEYEGLHHNRRELSHLLIKNIVIALAYFLFARAGLLFALVHGNVSLVWPPAGIALAVVFMGGIRVLPGVALGAFAANFAGDPAWLFPLAATAGNSGEALIGALLLRGPLRFRCELNRVRDILGLPLVAGISAMVAATAGAAALWYTGAVSSATFPRTWFHWWLGDTVGMMVVAPAVFVLQAYGIPKKLSWPRVLEGTGLMIAVTFGGLVLFGVAFPTWPALSLMVIPVLILIAFRFTLREVAFANLLVATGAAIGAGRTFGGSHPDILAKGLLTLSVLLLVSGLTTQLLAAVLAQWRRTERALRENEQKYRELVEHANSIILHWDCDGRIIFLNEYGLRFFGYTEAEILGSHIVGTIVPETESTGRDLRPLMEQISADPASFERNVNENIRRNGEKVWIDWTNKMAFDKRGKVEGILSIGTDITEQRRAEAALRESESRYRGLFEDCPISLWEEDFSEVKAYIDKLREAGVRDLRAYFAEHPEAVYDCAGRVKILDVNRATLELLEYDRREDLHSHLAHVFREESYETFVEELAFLAAGNLVFETEAVNCSRHGKLLHVTMTVAIVPGHQETWSRVFVAITDISSRVRAEEALRLLNEQLETRVEARTAELALAKERAEAADRVKSAFLAAMSHELRTPLNSIIGFTGIILQGLPGPLNPEQEKQLRMVQGSARHLLALINDVLDLSKIEAGQLETEIKLFDARASIANALQLVKPLADKKGLILSAELSPEVGDVKSDCRRFEQILINLISNAVKFTERGSVSVECGVRCSELVTRVTDTGMGIKPEDMGKLFRAFQQVDVGLTRNHEGTGLGLSICKGLVEKMGGRIWADSEWGVGSVFTFTLPLTVD